MDLFNLKKKRREKLMAAWGRRKPFHPNQYYERQLFEQKSYDFSIDEQTADDLDFDRFYNYTDRTTSVIGQQCLYERLRCAGIDEANREDLEKAIEFYDSNDVYSLVKALSKLKQHKDYIYPAIIYGDTPTVTGYRWLIRLIQLASFACILFGFYFPVLWFTFLPLVMLNMFIHYRIKQDMGLFIDVFSRLGTLYGVVKNVLPISHFSSVEKKVLTSKLTQLKVHVRKLKWLQVDTTMSEREGASVMVYVLEVIKFMTLFDVVTYYALIDQLPELRSAAESLYYAIGEVDVALSVLALRGSLAYFSKPDLSGTHRMNVKGLYHPLVKTPIANDMELKSSGVLVTGSNMSGKSTFIKTLNLNALAAQALNTSFAHHYASRCWCPASSMNTTDELTEGSSYYLEEVERIKTLLELSAKQDTPYLITIDEVFRGTNTLERVSSAKAVLDYLAKGESLVLVSTHDLELADLLKDKYALYYFQEAVVDQILSFDYKLKPGIMTERNAISILEIAGYPEEVVAEARRVAARN